MDFIITICLGFLFVWYAMPYAIKKLNQHQLRYRCRTWRLISLTYDDGPSTRLSEQLMDLLAEYNVKATFFVLGHKLQSAGHVLERVVQAGHEIGSHSFRHLNAWKRSPLAVYQDIKQGLMLTKAIGASSASNLFRPPHGKVTLATITQIMMNNAKLAWWTIDSSDTWATPIPVERVIARIKREGGGVILMHDHDRASSSEREEYVLELTRTILELARKESFSICRMGDIYGEDRRARLHKS
jgi:peptidoglycan/xylan/chitin deacetylase (PgdA/CDA1 family)